MMFQAARDGNVADLLHLLEADPLVLERQMTANTDTDTPLHVAAMLGHLDFVRELIKHKTNVVEYVKELNQQGFSPVHLAAAHGHVDVVRMLLEVSSEFCCLKGRDGMTPLHCAAAKGRGDVMDVLLSVYVDCVMEVTDRGETALHIAARNNRLDGIRVSLQWIQRSKSSRSLVGIINYKDCDGNTALHLAAARKNHQAIELLLSSCNGGVLEVNARNKRGLTALDLFMLCPCESGLIVLHSEAERLFRGSIGTRSIDNEQNISITPSISSSKDTILRVGDDNWITWRNYFKFQFDRDSPSSVREAFLVVAVLIASATYQTAQSIPIWGQLQASDKVEIIRVKRNLIFLYILSNTVGFLVSLDMILVLTSKFPLYWGLVVALHAIAINYIISVVGNAPSGCSKVASAVFCISLFLVIRLTSRCIRTRSRRQIHRSSSGEQLA